MSRAPTTASYILDGQALLYTRPNSTVYQLRFKIGKKWIHVTTGERDKNEAIKKSYEIYYSYKYKDSIGQPVTSKTFESIAKVVATELRTTGRSQDITYSNYINNRWIPFLKGKYINNITSEDYEAFFNDLEVKLDQKIKNITRRQHYVAINKVFDKAISLKHITASELPAQPMQKDNDSKSESRPAFTEQEVTAIINKLNEWIDKGHSKREKEKRFVLYHYVKLLFATGIRPGTESESITFGGCRVHIDQNGSRNLTIRVNGKTGSRDPVAPMSILSSINAVKATIKNANDNTLLLSVPTGKPFSEPQEVFKKFLIEHGLLIDKVSGEERSLYSCRHTYITLQLMRGTSIYTIANQCGNSVKMIEDYYSKIKPLMSATAITGALSSGSRAPSLLEFFE